MGNMLRHGIDMYKQTINGTKGPLKNEPQSPKIENPPQAARRVKPAVSTPIVAPAARPMTAPLMGEDSGPDSKCRRVAKFLILIGSEQAADILAELDPEQVEEISKEIALTKIIKPEEGQEILDEFHALFSQPYKFSGNSYGGVETARRILYAAKGAEKGEAILNKALPASKENLFSFLEEFSPEQLIVLLKNETAQVSALILSRLPPKISAATISKLPADSKAEILKRIAHQSEISPEVLEQVTAALKEKARLIGGGAKDLEIDGMSALAAILKQGDYAFGDRIISELEQASPDIGKDLKEKIYTLDDVVYTVDRPIQDKLKNMSERDIAILMKGRGKGFCEKLLSCVSAGRRKLIREEFEILGAVPKRDCDAAASEFLAWFRLERENGNIILYSDKDVFV